MQGQADDPKKTSYMWRIVMEGGQVIEFQGGNTAGAAQFVDDFQRFHLTGERPSEVKNFRFPDANHSTRLAADILVDISKVQMVLRTPLDAVVRASMN